MTRPVLSDIKVDPTNRTRLLLILKLLLIVSSVFAMGEGSWRSTGFHPTQSDLLVFDRFYRAARDSFNAVALVGSSRMLCDLDPQILKRQLPTWEFYQLAIDGSSPLPMLENLAQDPKFHGHVMCEFNTRHFMDEYPFRENDFHQLQYVHFTQRRPYLDFLKTWLFETLSQHSALLAAQRQDVESFEVRLASIVRSTPEHSSPFPPDVVRREDRFIELHRRGKDNSRAIAQWAQLYRSRGTLDPNGIQRVASWVEAIRRRGGDVVFVQLPVSGSLQRIEAETYADRKHLIESLAANGINVIDSAAEPVLRAFECSDESHLDADDAYRFSMALARMIEDRQLLPRRGSRPSTSDR
jgi:hypothetical protein